MVACYQDYQYTMIACYQDYQYAYGCLLPRLPVYL
jgi:hypothetical protein